MDTRIELIKADITQVMADAIVNAANTSLLGGGGVDGAIHRAGGKAILEDCLQIRDKQGGCPVGGAVITTAGKLSAEYVIHAVGPVWRDNDPDVDRLLANAYRNSLKLAVENGVKSIAFPSISTGIYRFPKGRAAEIAMNTVEELLSTNFEIEKVIFVCFDDIDYSIYKMLLAGEMIRR
ncbi:MAG: O-acetyl-ADP-ribose deacetylase [Mucilaginibacter sp.]